MANMSTIYTLSWLALTYFMHVHGSGCPVLECWFVRERPGGFPAVLSQEKVLLHIGTDPDSHATTGSDVSPERVYYVTDPAATFCHSSLHPPESAVLKPQCEINPFQPLPSSVQWAAPLTDSALSPVYLQADWFSAVVQGLDGRLVLSNTMRAATATNEPSVVLSVSSRTVSVQARLGEPVLLDCGFWTDSASPLSGSGFAVEWRYQFRGDGRLVLAYDGKGDRLADGGGEEGAELDVAGVHGAGNASLVLREAEVRHSGTYICTVHLPFIMAQVSMHLEIVEPPSLAVFPSPLPLSSPGQVVSVQCEASGFSPLALDLSWELVASDGSVQELTQGRVTGHRQAADGTYTQNTRLELDTAALGPGAGGRGGVVTCVAVHSGGTRRAGVALNVIGVSAPSIEDSMAMVAVALGLYGFIKVFSMMFSSSGSINTEPQEKKKN